MTTPTEQVAAILDGTYTPQGISMWLLSRNRNLRMQIPFVLIAAGRVDEVLTEARRVANS